MNNKIDIIIQKISFNLAMYAKLRTFLKISFHLNTVLLQILQQTR